MNGIVVVGSCMMDFVSYAPRLPKAGETIHGHTFATTFGGKGANQCVAAAKLAGNTLLVARVGGDIWADKYIENLQSLNMDVKYVQKTRDFSTGIAQITVSDTGENQIVIVGGANSQLTTKDVELAQFDISNAKVVVCQLETSWEVAVRAIQLSRGVSILNGAPAMCNYDEKLLTLPTIFCVNEIEASIFTNLPVDTTADAHKAIEHLLQRGCCSVILTLGCQGALYASRRKSKPTHIKSPVVKCVDSTGAGDAFIGTLAYLIANRIDLTIEKQIEIACFVASDSVTRTGTQTSFPGAEILEKFDN